MPQFWKKKARFEKEKKYMHGPKEPPLHAEDSFLGRAQLILKESLSDSVWRSLSHKHSLLMTMKRLMKIFVPDLITLENVEPVIIRDRVIRQLRICNDRRKGHKMIKRLVGNILWEINLLEETQEEKAQRASSVDNPRSPCLLSVEFPRAVNQQE